MDIAFGWLQDPPDSRDLKYASIRALATSSIPETVSLRDLMSPIESQGRMSSCVAQSIVGAIEFLQRKAGFKKTVDMSRMFLYYNARKADNLHAQDRGCIIRSAVKSLGIEGTCPESRWKYTYENLYKQPSKLTYWLSAKRVAVDYYRLEKFDIGDYKAALAEGYPVVFGAMLFSSFLDVAKTGQVPVPNIDTEKVLGGHAMVMVGYTRTHFIVRNSWGPNWGDKGYCNIPFNFFSELKLGFDSWVIREQKKLRTF